MSILENKNNIINAASPAEAPDRRARIERRSPTLTGFIIGCVKCRRHKQRRTDCDSHFPTDWYDTKLFFMAIALLLLSITDAAMTITLLNNGAVEVNPIMNFLLNQSIHAFVYTKLALTVLCTLVLVAHYHARLFNAVRVDRLLSFALSVYFILVTYELVLFFYV